MLLSAVPLAITAAPALGAPTSSSAPGLPTSPLAELPTQPATPTNSGRPVQVAAPSVPLDTLRARSQALREHQAAITAQLAAGEIQPFPEVREKWPQIVADNNTILTRVDDLNAMAKDAPARPGAERALLELLQTTGPFLHSAEHPPGAAHSLIREEAATLHELSDEIRAAQSAPEDAEARLDVVSPRQLYTLIHLPVPLAFSASPGQVVLLDSPTGGQFSNGLPAIRLIAGDEGIVRTTWLTRGNAVDLCEIIARSPGVPEPEVLTITVVTPVLVPIPGTPLTQ